MGVATAPEHLATRWWWVRHAPVTINNGCIYGQFDLSCDTGDRAAFARLAQSLPRDAVWVVSNLCRTHETAAAIKAEGLAGPDAIIVPEFAEQHFGAWQGRSYASLAGRAQEEYHQFWLAPAHHRPPGGESFDDLVQRVRRAIVQLNRDFAGRDIIAVAHGGTIRAAVAAALSLPSETALGIEAHNLSVTRLDYFPGSAAGDASWRIGFINRVPN